MSKVVAVAWVIVGGLAVNLSAVWLMRRSDRSSTRWKAISVGLFVLAFAGVLTAWFVVEDESTEQASLEEQLGEPRHGDCGVGDSEPGVAGFWGPDRATFTTKDPAPYATLNSITNNRYAGDERAFFDVAADLDTASGAHCNSLKVSDGEIVEFRAYVENSAADNLSGEQFDGPGVARGVRLYIADDGQQSSLRQVRATLSAENTQPIAIFDAAELSATQPFRIDFIPGSAVIATDNQLNGKTLTPDPWQAGGTLIGVDDQDGVIPPGYQYQAQIFIKARISFVN